MGPVMPLWLTVIVDVIAWGLVHAITGYAAHRLTDEELARDRRLLRPRAFEADGLWYRRRLRIHRWKDRVPEAGAFFSGGISKRRIPAPGAAGLRLLEQETRRAELGHWWALLCSPVFVLWNPPLASALLIAYGVGVNLPFIAIQRYNRLRVRRSLRALARRGADR